jgi:hypothetical protein
MGLEAQIQTQLAATSAVTDAVSTRIYRYQRPRGGTLPAVTFQRIDSEIINHSTGATDTQWARFQADCWADDMDTARTVADAVTTALSGWSNTGGTPSISMCHQQSDMDLTEPPEHGDDVMLYRISQDYRISHHS